LNEQKKKPRPCSLLLKPQNCRILNHNFTIMKASEMRQDMLKITGAAIIAGSVHFSYGRELSDWKCGPQYRWKTDVDIDWKEKWKDCGIRSPQQFSEVAEEVKDSELETIFKGLAKNWREETSGYSLTSEKYGHSSYKAILKLGPEVVPFILQELQVRPGRWLAALNELSDYNPTKPGDSFDEARTAWLDWGKQKGFIS
jgi:hypothetical protein